jgi:hypothetical protein
MLHSILRYWYTECLICAQLSTTFNACDVALWKPDKVDGTCAKFVPLDNEDVFK